MSLCHVIMMRMILPIVTNINRTAHTGTGATLSRLNCICMKPCLQLQCNCNLDFSMCIFPQMLHVRTMTTVDAYFLTYLLHAAQSFLRSLPFVS